ncbi:dihydrolipoamide acetyltransferase family protein [Mycoplasmoides genitalium]|uniref:dihydrolipoamide acetyltransferase family protein n=1 Tax=Mycoplasmoides genitalium TaxID=2097 RepID=UPI00027B3E2D|nr:dihydrolipoamide acetyltransferase family protein [Mycoplasmoides genitalium]AFQ03593.1 branched-chain alpha-keto acid dehydrogenase subunit E2 [Mycoplasmoides genitalium M6282]
MANEFKFTDVGEGLHEGKVTEILKQVGDQIKIDEALFVVETDKVTTELPSPFAGTISAINVKVGDVVSIGQVMAVIGEKTSTPIVEPKPQPTEEVTKVKEAGASVVGEIKVSDNLFPIFGVKPHATPAVKDTKVASSTNITVETTQKPESKTEQKTIAISTMRKAIAEAMTKSHAIIPTTVLTFYVNATKLKQYRESVNGYALSKYSMKISYFAFFVKAIVNALKKFPVFNASYDPDQNEIVLNDDINVGIAVDTEEGLIVPNIKQAQTKSVVEIAQAIVDLANKARTKKIKLTDLNKGTISVTNFGSLGAAVGTPIIKYPEMCIVATGNLEERIVKVKNGIAVHTILPLTIAADHRWVDGADVGRFGKEIAKQIEELIDLTVA